MPLLSELKLSPQNGHWLLLNIWRGLPFPSGLALHTRDGTSYCFCQTATKHLTKAVKCNKHTAGGCDKFLSQPCFNQKQNSFTPFNTGVTCSAVLRSKRLKDLAYIKYLLAQGSSHIQKTFCVYK